MQTTHRIRCGDARRMEALDDASVDLVVTSPPYPMIQMWDDLFSRLQPPVAEALAAGDGAAAFEAMHASLDAVWRETFRILKDGGLACINVGDAVRSVAGRFMLYPNQARILKRMLDLGFSPLPPVLWRKPTNSPNKFMGSGMLPTCAYVTLEHEHIMVLRKGANRRFSSEAQRRRRRESAYFWEERNTWFSDVWLQPLGTGQQLPSDAARRRSGAFPFEIPYRLINMYSIKGDTVVDPFAGTGTTLLAAMASGRNSMGWEIEAPLLEDFARDAVRITSIADRRIGQRLAAHVAFVADRLADGHRFKHLNRHYGFAVMTGQETDLRIDLPVGVAAAGDGTFSVKYADIPSKTVDAKLAGPEPNAAVPPCDGTGQLPLFDR